MHDKEVKEILIPLLQTEIVRDGLRFTLEAITGETFEIFLDLSPELDYSKLKDREFKSIFLSKLREIIFKEEYNLVFNNKGIPIPDPDSIVPDIDRDNIIETPLDIEGTNSKRAILLVERFFDLPIIEKEAYKLRIKNQSIKYQIKKLQENIGTIKKNKSLNNNIREEEIKSLHRQIKELEVELLNQNTNSQLSEFLSPIGILTIQRRASIRIKNQWATLKRLLNQDIISNTSDLNDY